MSTKFPVPGDVFEGMYRIDAILGSGGFARVYRGLELGIDRAVALKILRPPLSNAQSDQERDRYLKTLMERFQREAVLLSKLRAPSTVTMYSYGQTENGLLYMVLEFIDGITLTELSRAGKALPPRRVAKIIKQVLMSLREAHSMGMLHRDLKPGNIMLFEHMGERDQAKLLDFGIAKLVDEAGKDSHKEDLTSDGTLIGTPRYMAPEQIQGGEVGPASDIYALGLVAYELLVGRRAIEGDSSIQIISKQLTPVSFQLPIDCTVPPRLRMLVNRMMHKDLGRRYGSAEQILADLNDPFLLDDASIEMDLGGLDTEIEELSVADLEMVSVSADSDKRSRLPVFAVGVLSVVCLLLAGFIILNQDRDKANENQDDEVTVTKTQEYGDVTITAKGNGKMLRAEVLVNGILKGFTPLTLNGEETLESKITARYQDPNTGEKLQEEQSVSEPRDVVFEFEPQISEKIEIPKVVEKPVDIIKPKKIEKVAAKVEKKKPVKEPKKEPKKDTTDRKPYKPSELPDKKVEVKKPKKEPYKPKVLPD